MLTINIMLFPEWFLERLPYLRLKWKCSDLNFNMSHDLNLSSNSILTHSCYLPSSDPTSTSTTDNSWPCYFINCSWCLLTCCLLLKSLPLECPYPISISTWWVSDHPSSVNSETMASWWLHFMLITHLHVEVLMLERMRKIYTHWEVRLRGILYLSFFYRCNLNTS